MKVLRRRLASRALRRVLVGLYFALFLNGLAILFFGVGGDDKGLQIGALFGLMGALMLGGVFYLVSSPADFRPSGMLDERQNLVRMQAMADAYRILCIVLVGCHLVYALRGIYGYEIGSKAEAVMFLPFVFLLPNLPQALVAWREPDMEGGGE